MPRKSAWELIYGKLGEWMVGKASSIEALRWLVERGYIIRWLNDGDGRISIAKKGDLPPIRKSTTLRLQKELYIDSRQKLNDLKEACLSNELVEVARAKSQSIDITVETDSYWLNVKKPSLRCALHHTLCRHVYYHGKNNFVNNIERLSSWGGWIRFNSNKEAIDCINNQFIPRGYNVSFGCSCLRARDMLQIKCK